MAATLTGAAHRGLGGLNADASKLCDFLDDAYVGLSAAERLVHSAHGFVFDKVALEGVESAELEQLLNRAKRFMRSCDSVDLREALAAAEALYNAIQNEIRRTDGG